MKLWRLAAVAVAMATATPAMAAIFPEVEPNETRANATVTGCMVAGDSITGTTTGTATTAGAATSLDQFRVSTCALPAGIYRHRLVITSNTVGHTGTIRALTQTAAPADTSPGIPWDGVVGTATATDTTGQTSSTASTPPRYNQWFGFGQGENFYYRVTGGAATTAEYVSTLETVPVVPTDIGSYAPGQIAISTFGQGHSTDTDLWIYDSNFNPMVGYGNDDEGLLGGTPGAGTSLQSFLSRSYTPGVYYIALSNFQMQNNMASPSDDDFRTGSLQDFSGILVNSSTTTNLNMAFTISDSEGGTLAVPNTKVSQYDINFFRFTVTPEPTSLALLVIGAASMMIRRRKA